MLSSVDVLLSTGRTFQQGVALERGKYSDQYTKAAMTLRMDPDDMEKIGVLNGDKVKVRTKNAEVILLVEESSAAPHGGTVFLPYGPWANTLIGADTKSQGMPSYKNVQATVEKSSEELVKLKNL